MEKYLKLFFIALFATMSFSLTSCGDDDDEPSADGKYSCNLTVNGSKFPSKTICGEIWHHNGFDALTIWVNESIHDEYFIFETYPDVVSNGADITSECNLAYFSDDLFTAGEVKSGNVKVLNFDSAEKVITIQFTNAKFAPYMIYEGDEITLNGVMTAPLNGVDNTVRL